MLKLQKTQGDHLEGPRAYCSALLRNPARGSSAILGLLQGRQGAAGEAWQGVAGRGRARCGRQGVARLGLVRQGRYGTARRNFRYLYQRNKF